MKKTRVSAIEGRMIKSALIYPCDKDEGDPDHRGVTLELRLSGGKYFSFTAAPKIIPAAMVTIADNRTGTFENEDTRRFPSEDL